MVFCILGSCFQDYSLVSTGSLRKGRYLPMVLRGLMATFTPTEFNSQTFTPTESFRRRLKVSNVCEIRPFWPINVQCTTAILMLSLSIKTELNFPSHYSSDNS